MILVKVLKIVATLMPFFMTPSVYANEPTIELVPTFIWQGVPVGLHQFKSVTSIRERMKDFKVVHMLSPVYLMRSANDSDYIRSEFSDLLKSGDVVGMHIAPYKDWAIFSKSKPGVGRGIFGRSKDLCDSVCGLESEISGVSHKDLGSMILAAKMELKRNGFGEPRLAMFEEGLVADDIWQIALNNGMSEDWSGFNFAAARQSLDRYPFFSASEQIANGFGELSRNEAFHLGRSLDHIRFGVLVDAISLEQASEVLRKATEFAKLQTRHVLVPVIISVGSAVHVEHLVDAVLEKAIQIANSSGVRVQSWAGDYDGGWSKEGLKRKLNIDVQNTKAPTNVPVATVDHLSDEKLFDRDSVKEVSPIEVIPSSQKVINSGAIQLSH